MKVQAYIPGILSCMRDKFGTEYKVMSLGFGTQVTRRDYPQFMDSSFVILSNDDERNLNSDLTVLEKNYPKMTIVK